MKNRVPALLLVLALLPAAPIGAAAQTSDAARPVAGAGEAQDWQGLKGLKPGKKILVEFKPNIGDPVEAKFVSATGTKLTITSDGFTRSLERRDIRSVCRLKGKFSRRVAGRIGAVIGVFVGGFIGADIAASQEPGPGANVLPIAAGQFLGALAGSGLGRLLGGKRKGELLYEAR